MLKAILFDLDDTLLWDKRSVEVAFETTCKLVQEKYGINAQDFEKKVREIARQKYASFDTYSFTQMIGINPFEGLWAQFQDEGEEFTKLRELAPDYQRSVWTKALLSFGVGDAAFGSMLAKAFPEARRKNPFVFEQTFEVLDKLYPHYTLLLLTNGSPDLQHTKLTLTPELDPYFNHIVVSGAFGKGKPDKAIFEHALELLSVNREEAIMVGDNLKTDILGASRAGIQSIWINHHGKKPTDVQPTFEISNLGELVLLIEDINKNTKLD
ncbi:HAD family hydrolase [Oceanobacillus manasiensis]|uniref:HAD family hydrolase n=1 Tax=Oceanobacillus manasiensis TaxID=586413 RepID=UPI0005AB8BAB|nr:HAD family hydrolase [Oceanobacillus manasiensis]